MLPGHHDSVAKVVYHVECSPRGDLMATCGEDSTVRLSDVATGRVLRTLRGHKGDVNYVAFSPDGTTLATGGDDGTVRLWPLSGGSDSVILGRHENWVNCVLFTPDGRRVISAARDGRVTVWEVGSGRMVASVRAQQDAVEGMALSPDGRTLATGGWDLKVVLWDVESLRKKAELAGHARTVQNVAFSHDGLRLATASLDGTVKVWDVGKKAVIATCLGHADAVQCVAFASDDQTLASSGNDGTVRLWDIATGDLLQTYRAETDRQWCVTFAPNGGSLISCGTDGLIRIWDMAVPQDRLVIHLPKFELRSLALPEGSHWLLITGRPYDGDPRRVSVSSWDLKQGVRLETRDVETSRPMNGSVFSRNGKTLCTLENDGQLTLWDVATGRVTRTAPAAVFPKSHGIGGLAMIDNLVIFEKYMDNIPNGMVLWNPRGDRLRYFEVTSPRPLACIPGSDDFLIADDTKMARWNLEMGRVTPWGNPKGGSSHLGRFSHNGRFFAGTFGDWTIRLCEASTLEWQTTLLGHTSPVVDLDFSLDDKVLASISSQGIVKLWDVAARQELITLQLQLGLRADYLQLRFSPDGTNLVCCARNITTRDDSVVIIWPVDRPGATWP